MITKAFNPQVILSRKYTRGSQTIYRQPDSSAYGTNVLDQVAGCHRNSMQYLDLILQTLEIVTPSLDIKIMSHAFRFLYIRIGRYSI
jgi:hypothetical protein